MSNDFLTGENTQIRMAALVPGSRARPANSALKDITGTSTSDLKRGATDTTTSAYGSGKAEDGKVTRTNWSFSVSGNLPLTVANRTALDVAKNAAETGSEVWLERLIEGGVNWEGGVCSIMDYSEPAPSDGVVTFSFSPKGRGQLVKTPIVTTP